MYKGTAPKHPKFCGKCTVPTLQSWIESMSNKHARTRTHSEEGCLVEGTVSVNSVPDNFEIMARSPGHDFDLAVPNLSHIVQHF